jgi:hypothetical protein
MDLTTRIIEIAKSYIGQKEKPNNSGFVDPLFEKKQKARGWLNGQAWCAYTGELIWYDAFTELDACAVPLINKYFSGSAMESYRNFKASPEFKMRLKPVLGGILIWQHGDSDLGHMGCCVSIADDNHVGSVEGNTNAAGGREGIEVALKNRVLNLPRGAGLNYMGCVYPIRIK